jgi:cytochrome b subunit of formate dehydrogenase
MSAHEIEDKTFKRFSLSQRVEHIIFFTSFSILGFTGLVQKFAASPISQAIIQFLGGIETTRLIHRTSAVVMMLVSIYHLIAVMYRIYVKRSPLNMFPLVSDLRHVYEDILYYFDRRARKAYYYRYNYAEKAEYLAVVWGTIVMAVTGFMMWNPIATTKFFAGEFIPAAKAAHGAEAILAVAAIIIWHFYHVHLKFFNKSIFTGEMTAEQMEEEHPAELDEILEGKAPQPPSPQEQFERRQRFLPVAFVLTVLFSAGVLWFITVEETAIATVPRAESAEVFVPFTPTPTLPPTPTPTPLPAGAIASWESGASQVIQARCAICHIANNFGGLSLATYESTLQGGLSGPAVVPGEPDNSLLVQVQLAGNHGGMFTPDELQAMIAWIENGAPEK